MWNKFPKNEKHTDNKNRIGKFIVDGDKAGIDKLIIYQ